MNDSMIDYLIYFITNFLSENIENEIANSEGVIKIHFTNNSVAEIKINILGEFS